MRPLWKGALAFGLVTVPIRLFPATEDKTPSFNQLRASDHSRIGYKRIAKADGAEVDADEMVRGYEYGKDQYVVFSKEELESLRPSSSRTVEIHQFVPSDQIDPVYFQRSYYLAPEPAGAKAYGLLRQAMADRDTVAICKVTLRDKEHLATVRLRGELLVLETMYWPDEIRGVSLGDLGIDEIPEPRKQEVQMARTLIENLTEDFDPTAYRDEYRERLEEAVQAKVEGEEVTVSAAEEEPETVVDLMAALKESVEQSKRGEEPAKSESRSGRGKKAAS